MISPDGVIENYQKTHLYADEKLLFQPGLSGFKVFEWQGVNIGMMICFDWIFPESARTLALADAQIIAHPANLVMPYCQNAMVTRSIENKVFTITANRIGTERLKQHTLQFTGASQMTGPSGEILYRGPKQRETVHIATINPEAALNKKISKRNDLFKDRRPEVYQLESSHVLEG
jgi:predicted amidohydrolase